MTLIVQFIIEMVKGNLRAKTNVLNKMTTRYIDILRDKTNVLNKMTTTYIDILQVLSIEPL